MRRLGCNPSARSWRMGRDFIPAYDLVALDRIAKMRSDEGISDGI